MDTPRPGVGKPNAGAFAKPAGGFAKPATPALKKGGGDAKSKDSGKAPSMGVKRSSPKAPASVPVKKAKVESSEGEVCCICK